MLRLAIDQDFNEKIAAGVVRRIPTLDAVRVADAGLARATDPSILAWAAGEHRVVLSHDRRTMVPHAYERLAKGLPMCGVIIVRQSIPIGAAVDELCLMVEASIPEDLDGRVLILPL